MARPQKNNALYFSHDADMRNDVKVKALRRKFQHTGYAVWCFILESLTDCDYFEIDYNELNRELLAADFDVPVELLEEIVDYCCKVGLLQMTEDQHLYSEAHQRRFASLMEKRKRDRERLARLINMRQPVRNGETEAETSDSDSYHGDNLHSIVKEKSSTKKEKEPVKRFQKPTIEEVKAYIAEKGYDVDAERFWNFYEAKDWFIGKNKMKNWHAAVATWQKKETDYVDIRQKRHDRRRGTEIRATCAEDYSEPL